MTISDDKAYDDFNKLVDILNTMGDGESLVDADDIRRFLYCIRNIVLPYSIKVIMKAKRVNQVKDDIP